MNERFFELDKRKQDRIINSALSVFAKSGFSHASTDEITAGAGISKGLLFHYFGSKLGAYLFLYEYSSRYILLALRNEFRKEETDFFTLCRRLARAEAMIMGTYPCMLIFWLQSETERDPDVLKAGLPLYKMAADAYHELYMQAHVPDGLTKDQAELLIRMFTLCKKGAMQEMLALGAPDKDRYLEIQEGFIDVLAGRGRLQGSGRRI